ncbi:hypothetical protein Tco_0080515 [Tanacetum coccineum]
MQNLEDISNPTTALDMALKLMAKAFQLNNFTPTNNNQRSSSNPCNSQIAQSGNLVARNAVQNQGIQNIRNQNGLSVISGIANQHRNGNVVAARAEGNGNEINGNPIRLLKRNKQGFNSRMRNLISWLLQVLVRKLREQMRTAI